MTQRELNRAVAHATGESMSTVASLGFVPLTVGPVEREPLVVDWDELDESCHSPLSPPGRGRTAA
jgi:hypothetical protein